MSLFKRVALFLVPLATFAIMAGCAGEQKVVLADVGGQKVTLDEFKSMYDKNNGGDDAYAKATPEDRKKFLDLFLKFKLKVREAYDKGYDKDPATQAELQQYRDNLATTYLLARDLTDKAVHELYDRRSEEVRASHILIQIAGNDTLTAYNTAMKIIDSLKAGVPFEQLALDNSKDPTVKTNKGDLYWFTSGMMVPDFEEGVYALKKGEFSQHPIRTSFGYHVVLVTDRHTNPGSVRVSHIMKRLLPKSSHEDSVKAMETMEMVLDSLKNGADFAAMAKRYSDDTYTKDNGGDVGFIERRRTVKEFDEAAFNLKAGEISGIVKTPYGLHILKVTEIKPLPSFKEMEPDLRQFYVRYRYNKDYDQFVDDLKAQYHYTVSDAALAAFKHDVDTLKTTSNFDWDSTITPATRAMTLISFDDQRITVDSVISLVKNDAELNGLAFLNPSTYKEILDKMAKKFLVAYRARQEEGTFPDFQRTMKEYQDGILLFRAEQEEVWNRVSASDSALHAYYDANRGKFTWPDRVNVQELHVATDSLANLVNTELTKNHVPFDTLVAKYNQRATTKAKNGEWGLQPVTTNELTRKAWTMKEGETSTFFPYEQGFSIIRVLEKDPARDKTFEEAGTELSSAYQEYESKRLEDAWYERLKQRYPVQVDTAVVDQVLAAKPVTEAASK